MKVYMDRHLESGIRMGRKIVEVELVKDKGSTLLVKLPDGSVIKRKKKRDIPQEVTQ